MLSDYGALTSWSQVGLRVTCTKFKLSQFSTLWDTSEQRTNRWTDWATAERQF